MYNLNTQEKIRNYILSSSEIVHGSVLLAPNIEKSIIAIVKCFRRGNKVVLFGNGGGAADAQHIAAEFIGRFKINRKSLPAIALSDNPSTITAISNDFSFDLVFSRQCESLISKGDVVIGISTSGNSLNVKKGINISKKKGAITIGLLGNKGGSIKKCVDIPLIVNATETSHIQEVHRIIYHVICEIVERKLVEFWNKK
jgi:D-sedoheptulose 7-phosphate isomerase